MLLQVIPQITTFRVDVAMQFFTGSPKCKCSETHLKQIVHYHDRKYNYDFCFALCADITTRRSLLLLLLRRPVARCYNFYSFKCSQMCYRKIARLQANFYTSAGVFICGDTILLSVKNIYKFCMLIIEALLL